MRICWGFIYCLAMFTIEGNSERGLFDSFNQISIEILDDANNTVLTANGDDIKVKIPNAKLWNAEHSNLYTCRVTVQIEWKIIEVFGVQKAF